MQDEVNEKVVALSIKTSKLTAEVLQKAMKAVLAKGKQQLSKAPHGKITMRQLMKPGEKVTNIEITDANIKSFDPIPARTASLSPMIWKLPPIRSSPLSAGNCLCLLNSPMSRTSGV